MSPDASGRDGQLPLERYHGYYIEDLAVGMSAFFGKTVTDADLVLFSGVSGDTNPMHINRDFATGTRFGGPIVHGMLTASFISTVIGTRLPGPGCVYLSQSLRFKAPVRVGDTVQVRATVKEIQSERRRVIIDTACMVGDTVVLDGEALIMVPSRAQAEAAQ
ncbi:MAG: MaoC family dehydratase [Alphaproteobacteria bacterium]|nr:MaoC family dehydratase [Alphaproteobacteria bacterium]